MIPRTYPSRVNSTTGRVEALVSFISSTTGLQRWVDYTPVAFVTDATPVEGSYNNNGYIAVADVGSTTGLQAGKDYIRVYLDPDATDAWRVNSVGFIPVGYSGIGGIPYALFANNEQGVWYDPSDRTTLFQDSAGTTPVTAVEQPVGLMLDKSKGLVLGPVAWSTTTFSEGWTNSAYASVVSGTLVLTNAPNQYGAFLLNPVGLSQNKYYEISFEIVSISSGAVSVSYGYPTGNSFPKTTAGTHVVRGYATDQYIRIYGVGTSTSAVIDNISVRELPGNHAFQATSTSRPVLSARYNLLTKTEQFDDGAWSKIRASIIPNAVAAPDGTLTADKLVEDTTAGNSHTISCQFAFSSGTSYTLSTYVKAAERGYVLILLPGAAFTATTFATFSLSDGTVTQSGNSPTTNAVSVGNGWWKVSITKTATATVSTALEAARISVNGTDSGIYTGDGTSGIYIWGADLRVTNDAAGQPAYQRVNTATDYDTTGFKPYLRFDGTDDWLQTNSINFTATDKMTVFAGVRKLSDAASGTIAELSAILDSNNGSFALFAPRSGTVNAPNFVSRGTLTANPTPTSMAYPAPITNVITGIGDISGDTATIRANGSQVATTSADQGTGNYGNYPLYIGRRGGTTLPFNGRLYGLIVRGAATTTATIQATETYMNGKTGAY